MAASSSPVYIFTKDPSEILDYSVDWGQWLGDDTILSSSWVLPSGIANNGDVYSSTTATIWLSGGTAGTTYSIQNLITTTTGRTTKRTFKINVVDR